MRNSIATKIAAAVSVCFLLCGSVPVLAQAPTSSAVKASTIVSTDKVPVKTPAKPVVAKKVPVKPKPPATQTLSNGSQYKQETVKTANGSFVIDLVTIPLTASTRVLSETSEPGTCTTNCSVKSLQNYVTADQGFAAIHGAYFCPSDYPSCAGQVNSFDAPFYNSDAGVFSNPNKLTDPNGGALLVFDNQNHSYFYPNPTVFGSVAQFEATHHTNVQAAIGNTPALVYNGKNIVGAQPMDAKQRTEKSSRGGIGVKGSTVYLVIAHSATVPDLAAIMTSLGMDNALNLDGGGSSALYFNGAYKYGPGRTLPTAIVFQNVGTGK